MITRSTYGTFRQVTELMQTAAVRLQESQLDAASLDRLRYPSDHPLDTAEAMRLEADLAEHEALTDRLLSVTNELATVDGALGEGASLLVAAKEIAVAMESETVTGVERATAAQEVSALIDSMVSLANTNYNGIYLFAGTAVDTEPFDVAGTYQGSGQGRTVPLIGSDTLTISYPGSEIFADPNNAVVDVFASMQGLYDALIADDTAAIATGIGEIDASHSYIVSVRGSYGAAYSRAEDATWASEDASVALQGFIGGLTELDMVETFSMMAQAQTIYEAAATTLSTTLQTNIFKYL
jgi:flagellar hook-associated protein 3 FlgL